MKRPSLQGLKNTTNRPKMARAELESIRSLPRGTGEPDIWAGPLGWECRNGTRATAFYSPERPHGTEKITLSPGSLGGLRQFD
jgi:hypothetical protein